MMGEKRESQSAVGGVSTHDGGEESQSVVGGESTHDGGEEREPISSRGHVHS